MAFSSNTKIDQIANNVKNFRLNRISSISIAEIFYGGTFLAAVVELFLSS